MSFSYRNAADDIDFKCNFVCQRCKGRNRDGSVCKRNSCKYLPYCFTHLRTKCGLVVKRSTIPGAGDGLFAVRSFEEGDVITVYYGEKLTPEENDERYGEGDNAVGPYGVTGAKAHDGALRIIDGPCFRSAAVFANDVSTSTADADHRPENYNATLDDRYLNVPGGDDVEAFDFLHGSYMCVVATEDIDVEDGPVEIFVDYGAGYWDAAQHIQSAVKKHKMKRSDPLKTKRSPTENLYEGTQPETGGRRTRRRTRRRKR